MNKNEFKNDYRSRILIKDKYSLLLENKATSKKFLIKISSLLSKFTTSIQIINRTTLSDMLKQKGFLSKVRLFNYFSMRTFLLIEASKLIYYFYKSYNKKEFNESEYDSISKCSNSAAKIFLNFFFGRVFNYYTPYATTSFIVADFMSKYGAYLQSNNFKFDIESNSSNSGKTIYLKKMINSAFFSDILLKNMLFIDLDQVSFQKFILSYGIVNILHMLFNDNKKLYSFGNLAITYFNSKYLKVFFAFFLISKFSNFLGLIGFDCFNLHTTDGLIMTTTLFAIKNIYYLPCLSLLFIFNPYSLYIFSSAKNSLEEEVIEKEYRKKNYLRRLIIRTKFMFLNLFFFSKNLYF